MSKKKSNIVSFEELKLQHVKKKGSTHKGLELGEFPDYGNLFNELFGDYFNPTNKGKDDGNGKR